MKDNNPSNATYSTDSTSNRLNQIERQTTNLSDNTVSASTLTLSHDAAGNLTSDGSYTLGYDLRGRLTSASQGGITSTAYAHDNAGQRVRKHGSSDSSSGNSSTVIFVYDPAGQLLGEYDSSGKAMREHVWLGNLPVAMFMPDPAQGTNASTAAPLVYYIHADHLNTPRVLVDKTNTLRWRWMSEPFGTTAPDTSPAGQTALSYPLRMPGQYHDAETGMFYNYQRDYIPGVGRYAQSDPIGLQGGINTFAYVGGNPLSRTDRLGLATDQDIRSAVAALRCANPGEFNKLARSITMTDLADKAPGLTDWRNNILLNSRDYGDSNTPLNKFNEYAVDAFLQTIAHEMLHVNQGLASRLLSNSFRMGSPLGYFHRQLDEKAEAMITPVLLKQFRDALSSGDAGCTCSR